MLLTINGPVKLGMEVNIDSIGPFPVSSHFATGTKRMCHCLIGLLYGGKLLVMKLQGVMRTTLILCACSCRRLSVTDISKRMFSNGATLAPYCCKSI